MSHTIQNKTRLLNRVNRISGQVSAIEKALKARGKAPKDAALEEMDALWNEAKAAEKSGR